ncbi:hypothetical protein PR048_003226 [Dryococelus australis]|uniref:Uncharacterized protein n=1 Tax=Dryococelus australis TaxID=614101 RepID=A0ABQ9IME1_9NEOP|nr:hypothetical protein PR048_003226 [Dryococelus australis]
MENSARYRLEQKYPRVSSTEGSFVVLTVAQYLLFMQRVLPELLEDVPLAVPRRMWLQYDGAPPHFSVVARSHMYATFPGCWFQRGVQIPGPARTPVFVFEQCTPISPFADFADHTFPISKPPVARVPIPSFNLLAFTETFCIQMSKGNYEIVPWHGYGTITGSAFPSCECATVQRSQPPKIVDRFIIPSQLGLRRCEGGFGGRFGQNKVTRSTR